MTTASANLTNRNTRTALIFAAVAAAMLGLGFASVPLYRLFCQVTGFAGTTQRVTEAEADTVVATSKVMTVRFDANVERGFPWEFRPAQIKDSVTVGARDMAIFTAKNLSDKPITGTATFNVEPEYVGKYFNKVQCFCFTEQTLQPGQEVRMPVLYFIDPAILDDKDAKDVESITLSYTFHPIAGETANGLDRTGSGS
ncbi:MAG: cytochrome c oxidase assembly protein [Novosphingobium sp.]|nr:cytochrome c oxidase assembly protein [Novosphingobium sp.]